MKNKPLILVTNDDGISAPGIRILTEIMSKIGEVWVVAPEKARSGMGHAITIENILKQGCPDLRRKRTTRRSLARVQLFRHSGRLCQTGEKPHPSPSSGHMRIGYKPRF